MGSRAWILASLVLYAGVGGVGGSGGGYEKAGVGGALTLKEQV